MEQIIYLSKGKPKVLSHEGIEFRSGISKDQVEQLEVTSECVVGDDVENHEFHGGADRVICLYPYEHYLNWEQILGRSLPRNAFGENITALGMTEKRVCIGDIYRIGDAVLQVSQGRFPCDTINKHTQIKSLLSNIIVLGHTGYFFRVLEEGVISSQSEIELVERHPKRISIMDIHHAYFHQKDLSKIEKILIIDELSLEWKNRFLKLHDQLTLLDQRFK